jgi:hypothetical protein
MILLWLAWCRLLDYSTIGTRRIGQSASVATVSARHAAIQYVAFRAFARGAGEVECRLGRCLLREQEMWLDGAVATLRDPVGPAERLTARDGGHGETMRLRDHNKGDLALTALTLTVAAAAAARGATRWATRRQRRRHASAHVRRPTSK